MTGKEWVKAQDDVHGTALVILSELAELAPDGEFVTVPLSVFASAAHVSRPMASHALKGLRRSGHVKIREHAGVPCEWRLNLDDEVSAR